MIIVSILLFICWHEIVRAVGVRRVTIRIDKPEHTVQKNSEGKV